MWQVLRRNRSMRRLALPAALTVGAGCLGGCILVGGHSHRAPAPRFLHVLETWHERRTYEKVQEDLDAYLSGAQQLQFQLQ